LLIQSFQVLPVPCQLVWQESKVGRLGPNSKITFLVFAFAAFGGKNKKEEIIGGDSVLAISLVHHAGQAGRGPNAPRLRTTTKATLCFWKMCPSVFAINARGISTPRSSAAWPIAKPGRKNDPPQASEL
jgi:hypothetical protein